MEKKPRVWTKWLYWFSFAVAIIFVYKALDNFSQIMNALKGLFNVITPFFIGTLIAYILYMPCKKIELLLEKTKKMKLIKKYARLISVFLVYFLVILSIVILIKCLVPTVIQSVGDLVSNYQWYYDELMKKYQQLPENSILKTQLVAQGLNSIKSVDLKEYVSIEKVTDYLKTAYDMATGLYTAVVSIIVSVYIIIDRSSIVKFFKKFANAIFPKATYDNLDKYFDRTNDIFFKFISSQLIDAIVVGILITIALKILGVKYGLFLGIMIGAFNMIPYVGAIIAIVLSILITIFTGGIGKAISLAIVVIIIQQIDANIINPKIVGGSLKISPLLVIFAVTVGGAYGGIVGMFLAVPIAAVFKLMIMDYIEYKNNKKDTI